MHTHKIQRTRYVPRMEVACHRVGLDLVQSQSLSVRDNLVLEERIRPVSGAEQEKRAGGRAAARRGVSVSYGRDARTADYVTVRRLRSNERETRVTIYKYGQREVCFCVHSAQRGAAHDISGKIGNEN